MKGVVSGGSQYTVDVGAATLRRGGNAVDAAVAAAFASFVAEAAISAPGGGGFALVNGPDRDPLIYDFFCAMPGLGREDLIPPNMDFTAVPITFEDVVEHFHVGRGATAVPGNIAGLAQLLEDAGTLPLDIVLQPAIRLAREGYTLTKGQAYLISIVGRAILCYTPGSAAIFAPEGDLLRAGDHFANPALANTFERIAVEGWESFYAGSLAELLIDEHRVYGGLITADDLDDYRVIRREPLRFSYRDYTLLTNPPPSLGGILIAYALRLLEHVDVAEHIYGDWTHIAVLAEIMRSALVARFRDHPEQLQGPDEWAAWLDGDHIETDLAEFARAVAMGPIDRSPDLPDGPSSTTHISVMDETGLAVGITTTPGETAGYTVGNTGLLMNNILGEAEVNPDGFHMWEPGTRLASMMAPTMVVDSGDTRLVVGSGGASRLRSAMLQVLSNVLDWHMPLPDAVRAARVHFEDNRLDLEAGFDPVAADILEARGYRVTRWHEQSLYFGGTHVVGRAPDGSLIGAGDARRGGAVAVVE
jgi:gamma-glutamyltranspeptidase/glutathione hydrolase